MREEKVNAEIEDFLEGFNQPVRLPRHADQWAVVIAARVV
jgi:hypothetical protein